MCCSRQGMGKLGQVDERRVGRGLTLLPSLPNYCVVQSGSSRVVCVNGTGGLGGQIGSCFRDGRRNGARLLITSVSHFRAVMAGAGGRSLLLRVGLVGHCRPGCGVGLGRKAVCPCLGIAGRGSPRLVVASAIRSSNNVCFKPCPRICTTARARRFVRGVCPLHGYTGGSGHTYLCCRVNRYVNYYSRRISGRRCSTRVGHVTTFLGNSIGRVGGSLHRGVRHTTRDLGFRRTTSCHSRVDCVRTAIRGRAIVSHSCAGHSIFTFRVSGN